MLAWAVTVFDVVGGGLLALGYIRKLLCAGFIVVLAMRIFLVPLPNGWFVVGHQKGGIEHSVLLILCFLVVASNAKHPATTC